MEINMDKTKQPELMPPAVLLKKVKLKKLSRSWSDGRGSYHLTVNEKNEKESISNISQLLVEAETSD